ncbi:cobalt ECF transporter T component CbiQ [Clostridiaceae bacterium 35-E11]
MLSIDQYAYSNALKNIHPMEKFWFALMTLGICLVSQSWQFHMIVIVTMTILTVGRAKIPLKFYGKLAVVPIFFLVLGVLTITFVITKESSVVLYGVSIGDYVIGVSAQGLRQVGVIFFRAYAAVSCLYFLALTTPMVDLIWVLKKLKTPTILTELMMIIYRFIFVLLETASLMYISQDCRLGYISHRQSYHSLGKLVSNLFLKAFYRAKELFIALSTRGYTGDILVLEDAYCLSVKNIICITLIEILFILMAILV